MKDIDSERAEPSSLFTLQLIKDNVGWLTLGQKNGSPLRKIWQFNILQLYHRGLKRDLTH